MKSIKLIISDFDGTLADTFMANYYSYREVMKECGLALELKQYKAIFGLRFDAFMVQMGITDNESKQFIKQKKRQIFENYFHYIKINAPLLQFIRAFRNSGGMAAIASTADRINLLRVTDYLDITHDFDTILTGEEVDSAKPDPEIYLTLMRKFDVKPNETLIFEDSEPGLEAARASDACYIKVNTHFFCL